MRADDLIAIGLWLGTVLLLFALAWEPFRMNRKRLGVAVEGVNEKTVSPLYVFFPAVALLAAPFVAQLATRPVNLWRQPHLLLPQGLILLAGCVVAELGFRKAFLNAARRAEEDRARKAKVFEGAD